MNTIRRIFKKSHFLYSLVGKARLSIRKLKLKLVNENNAKTFNEKILLRIKMAGNPELAKKLGFFADKYLVKSYVESKIGSKYVVPLLFVGDELNENVWNKLPKKFVIKTNFGTGAQHYHIVENKDSEIFDEIKKKFDIALCDNWFNNTSEYAYKYIERKIIIEEYMPGVDGKTSPDDFKLHMFRNKDDSFDVVVQVDTGRFEKLCRNFYDNQFNLLDIHYTGSSNFDFKLPIMRVKEMIKLSEVLISDLTYARVDWYYIDDMIYFGEITHTHVAGNAQFYPKSADRLLGDKIKFNDIFR
ncbi:ATP-grasp fold amidoligase family protein [Vibrio kanaloae]|uniref:ATP-grasp fold amidoligase family protein n=1 Tax=Vibrio kanaloae TaxID=170673 RepID=UPI00354C5A14